MNKSNSIQDYIIKYKKYPPQLIDFGSEFLPKWVFLKTKPIIMHQENIISGRRKKKGQKISRTPAFVLFNRVFWGKNVLNTKGIHAGNNFDLSTPKGMALFLHEQFHVYQFYRNPIKFIFQLLISPFLSLLKCGILFAHEVIPLEIEAIKFQKKIERKLSKPKYKNQLKIFRLRRF
ncbi:MAG: hypothetical protein ACTSRZ_00825 [Promethearchaeota archaeon]